jgi:hypothetical protein
MTEKFVNNVKDVLRFTRRWGSAPADSGEAGSERAVRAKEAALDALRSTISDCRKCKLSRQRTHIVFGEGNAKADVHR